MTPSEHEALQMRARAIAAENLLNWTVDLLAFAYARPLAAERLQTLQAMREKLDEYRREYSTLTLENLSAAESDLWAGEFQEAFDSLSDKLIRRMTDALL